MLSIIGSIENKNSELSVLRSHLAGSKLMVVDARKVVTILTQNLTTAVKKSSPLKRLPRAG